MMARVFSSQELKIELKLADNSWEELIETTGLTKTNDANVDERDTIGDIFTKRTVTGGIKHDFSFETKLVSGNNAHKELRSIIFGNDVTKYNDREIRITFPISASEGNTKQRTETYKGVIKPTADGGQQALDLAVLNFDFMSTEAPVVIEEAA
jgi:hypothetical protein